MVAGRAQQTLLGGLGCGRYPTGLSAAHTQGLEEGVGFRCGKVSHGFLPGSGLHQFEDLGRRGFLDAGFSVSFFRLENLRFLEKFRLDNSEVS